MGFGADGFEAVRLGDLVAVLVLDVKRVDGGTFFGGDFGEADVEAQVAHRLGECVEETKPVFRLNFDDGPALADFVVELETIFK